MLVLLLLAHVALCHGLGPAHCRGSTCLEHRSRGNVLVRSGGDYLPVCDDRWDKMDADVACKEAGFERGALKATTKGNCSGLDFAMDEVQCQGSEARLAECGHHPRHDCGCMEAAGAVCDSATDNEIKEDETKQKTCFVEGITFSPDDEIGEALVMSLSIHCQQRCASNSDCLQFSFNIVSKTCHIFSASSKRPHNPFSIGGPPRCPGPDPRLDRKTSAECATGVCLLQGPKATEGNVFLKGKPVCDDGWGELEADTVCRQLNYTGGAQRYTTNSMFDLVPAPFVNAKFSCGEEGANLSACARPVEVGCDSGEAAGVSCDTRAIDVIQREKSCFIPRMKYKRRGSVRPVHPVAQLLHVKTDSAADCQERCKRMTGSCSHFTWYYSGGKCKFFLFDGVPEESKVADLGAVSGPMECAYSVPDVSQPGTISLSCSEPPCSEGIVLLGGRPVCDDGWSIEAAHVVCQSPDLVYHRAISALTSQKAVTDVFALDQVNCKGNEAALLDCEHQVQENCNSGEAAGVVCDTRSLPTLEGLDQSQEAECYAKNVIFGPPLTPEVQVLPFVMDCQQHCASTQDCNTFSYNKTSKECRLHKVGQVESVGQHKPQPSSTEKQIMGIKTKTDPEDRALCVPGDCTVKLRITDLGGTHSCETTTFTDLQPGTLDTFNGTRIGSCLNKTLTGSMFTMTVIHRGNDGWTGEWVKVFFTDGSTAHCPLGIFLDDTSEAEISCILTNETEVAGCSEGSVALSTGCYSFPIVGGPKNWIDAKEFCEQSGGFLAEVTSAEETGALYTFINDQAWASQYQFWIGLSDRDTEGRWVWNSGSFANFTSWAPSEPNNRGSDGRPENCVHLTYLSTKWYDAECNITQPVGHSQTFLPLCEFTPDPSRAINKEFLNSDSTVVSGPANCSYSQLESTCRRQSGLCLAPGDGQREGNVYYQGNPICDDLWGMREANLVCQELGYGKAKEFKTNSAYGTVKGPMKEAFCLGSVGSFSDCRFTKQEQSCIGEEAAGVVCESEDEKLRREEEKDTLSQCFITDVQYFINGRHIGLTNNAFECQLICNIDPDCHFFTFDSISKFCFNSSGEAKTAKEGSVSGPKTCAQVQGAIKVADPTCLQPGQICLGGMSPNAPRPAGSGNGMRTHGNIFIGGKPVCDDGWSLVNAEVLCGQLGFYGVRRISAKSHYGFTSGYFAMDEVNCHGNETSILDCSYSDTDDCYGGEAAGVECDTRNKEDIDREKTTIRDCFVADVIYGGRKLDVDTSGMASSIDCQRKCQQTASCTHFTFWPTEIAKDSQDCSKICLQGGSAPWEGNVIVENKPVCDDRWNITGQAPGNVACKELGFLGLKEVRTKSTFGSEGGADFSMDQVMCTGSETRLKDCRHDRHDDCGAGEAAGVVCIPKQVAATDDMMCELYSGAEKGTNKTVVGGAITGPRECSNPVSPQNCSTTGISLRGGNKTFNGKPYDGNVFYQCKPVCDDSFDILAANAVCKELGFSSGARRVTSKSAFGNVSQIFSLDEVACFGTEVELKNCSSSDTENCDGTESAGVECDISTPEEIELENTTKNANCFSHAFYMRMGFNPISFNRTMLPMPHGPGRGPGSSRGPGPGHPSSGSLAYADNVIACQTVCAATQGCLSFIFNAEDNYCAIYSFEAGGDKSPAGGHITTGPKECTEEAPVLMSYNKEDCLAPGVACVGGGRGPWEGVAHIGGRPVCAAGWLRTSARVFCRQMGFRDVFEHGLNASVPVKGPFAMTEVRCKGSEPRLDMCAKDAPVTNCLQWEGAEVRCERFDEHPGTTEAPQPEQDCSVMCLTGSEAASSREGNLFVKGKPVCDDEWGIEDASVVCRELGFPGVVNYTKRSMFGALSTSTFIMDDVRCTGMEDTILSCRHNTQDDCGQSEGAGAICLPMVFTPSASTTASSGGPSMVPGNCSTTVYSGQWANSLADQMFHMQNILTDECDAFNYYPNIATYWLAPAGAKASLVLDLGCEKIVTKLHLKNTKNAQVNNRGLRDFSISLSNATSGPWRTLLNGTMPDARNNASLWQCDVDMQVFDLLASLPSDEARKGRALRLEALSWYGQGAGLQYLGIDARPPAGVGGPVVGAMFLVALLLGLAALAWIKRERVEAIFQESCKPTKAEIIRPKYNTQQSQQGLVNEGYEE